MGQVYLTGLLLLVVLAAVLGTCCRQTLTLSARVPLRGEILLLGRLGASLVLLSHVVVLQTVVEKQPYNGKIQNVCQS